MHAINWCITSVKQHLWVLLFLLCIFSQSVHASSLLQSSESFRREWFKINYYHQTKTGIESEIINASFFIDAKGRTNPAAELDAFVNVLNEFKQGEKSKVVQAHDVLCKFPARVTLLSRYLDWFSEEDRPLCADFNNQNQIDKVTSLSLLFASGYFGSPSSYFGHNLLKVNYADDVLNQKTLDSSLNYGAEVRDQTSSPLYFFHGLTGGYDAGYQRNNNFIHSHNYTNAQLRDLWEFKLNLSSEQVKFVLEHAWELNNARFPYYFFTDNCAHRVIRLIEMATDKNLSFTHGGWLLPIQTVYYAHEQGLISAEEYHQSLKTQFENTYSRLSFKDKKLVKQFLKMSEEMQKEQVKRYSSDLLFIILMRLDIQVAQLTLQKTTEENKEYLQAHRGVILAELFQRSADTVEQHQVLPDTSDTLLTRQPVSVLWAGPAVRNNAMVASVRYQIAHNDLLTKPMPNQTPSRFIMGAGELDIADSRVHIRDVTLFDILNLNTSILNETLLDSLSWGLSVAYASPNRICVDCSTFGVKGLVGKSYELNHNTHIYGLVGGRLNHRQTKNHNMVTLHAETGMLFDLTPNTRLKFGIDAVSNINHLEPNYTTHIDVVKDISKRNSLRITTEIDDHGKSAMMLKLGFYFN